MEDRATTQATMQAIGAELHKIGGKDWTWCGKDDDHWVGKFTHTSGVGVLATNMPRENKWSFGVVDWPKSELTGERFSPSKYEDALAWALCDVGISKSKDPATIARDLRRRLLSKLPTVIAQMQLRLAQDDELALRKSVLEQELAAVVGGTVRNERGFDSRSDRVVTGYFANPIPGEQHPSHCSLEAKVNYRAKEVDIKIGRLTPDQAKRVLATLKEVLPPQGEEATA